MDPETPHADFGYLSARPANGQAADPPRPDPAEAARRAQPAEPRVGARFAKSVGGGPVAHAVVVVARPLREDTLEPYVVYRYDLRPDGPYRACPAAEFDRAAPPAGGGAWFRPLGSAVVDREPPHRLRLRHYKGGLYVQLHEATLDDGGATAVVYRSEATGADWLRLADDFYLPVAWPDGITRPRFVPADPGPEA